MTSDGNNFNDFPENQLTKVRAVSPFPHVLISCGGRTAPLLEVKDIPIISQKCRHVPSIWMYACSACDPTYGLQYSLIGKDLEWRGRVSMLRSTWASKQLHTSDYDVLNRAVQTELFTVRILCRVSYRVLEYLTDTRSRYRVVQNKRARGSSFKFVQRRREMS